MSRLGPGSGPIGGPSTVAERPVSSVRSAWPCGEMQTVVLHGRPGTGIHRSSGFAEVVGGRGGRLRRRVEQTPRRRPLPAARRSVRRPAARAGSSRPAPAPGSPTARGTAAPPCGEPVRDSRPAPRRPARSANRSAPTSTNGGACSVSSNTPVPEVEPRATRRGTACTSTCRPDRRTPAGRGCSRTRRPTTAIALWPQTRETGYAKQRDRAVGRAVDPVPHSRLAGHRDPLRRVARQQALERVAGDASAECEDRDRHAEHGGGPGPEREAGARHAEHEPAEGDEDPGRQRPGRVVEHPVQYRLGRVDPQARDRSRSRRSRRSR